MILLLIPLVLLAADCYSQPADEYRYTADVFFYTSAIVDLDEGDVPGVYGAGVGYRLSRKFAVEAIYTRGSDVNDVPQLPDPETGDPGYTSHDEEVIQLFLGRTVLYFSNGRTQPYLAFGLGYLRQDFQGRDRIYPDGVEEPPQFIEYKEMKQSLVGDAGAGLKYYFSHSFAIRAEAGFLIRSPLCLKGALAFSYQF